MAKVEYNQHVFGSMFKLMNYLGRLTKEPLSICIEGITQTYSPPDRVAISDKFFRNFNCARCGVCCSKHAHSLVFTQREMLDLFDGQKKGWLGEVLDIDQKQRITNALTRYGIRINNNSVVWDNNVYVYSNKGGRCNFLTNDTHLCEIHWNKPTLCALPHIQIDSNVKKNTRLLKRQHGRNWAFGCPTKPLKFDMKVFLEWDMPVLKKLLKNSEDLKLRTWLPEIIYYLENNIEKFREGILPKGPIVIYDRKRNIPEGYLL